MKKYFGTDGIRGCANQEPITPQTVVKIAQAFGIFLKKQVSHPKIILGKDTRISGYVIENALASGFASVGVDIVFLGPIPTPAVAYFTKHLSATAGVVISASHNPYYDNGIKLFDKDGFKLSDEQELEIESLIESDHFNDHLVSSDNLGSAKRIDDASERYAKFLASFFNKTFDLQNKKIVIDCANGAAYKIAPLVFDLIGIPHVALHTNPNGFNINADCGALHTAELQKKVLEEKAAIGFAFDGDADRVIVVDENGHVIDGDQIITLCALALQSNNKLKNNGVCVTIMSNKGLDQAMHNSNIQVIRTPVGDREIVSAMRKNDYVLGGEQSGHILFLDASTTGDGVLAAIKVLEVLCNSNKPISELAKVMTKFPQITKNVKTTQKPHLSNLKETSEKLLEFEKLLGDQGRIFMRYSGTEPLVRITAEGQNHNELEEMVKEIEKIFLKEIKLHS